MRRRVRLLHGCSTKSEQDALALLGRNLSPPMLFTPRI